MQPTPTPVPSGFTEFMNHFDGIEGLMLLFGLLIFSVAVLLATFYIAEGIAYHFIAPWIIKWRKKKEAAGSVTSRRSSGSPEDDEAYPAIRAVVLLWFFYLIFFLGITAVLIGLSQGDGGDGVVTSPTPTATVRPDATPTPTLTPVVGGIVVSAVPYIKFDTTEITVGANTEVTIRFSNRDNGIPHNFAAYTDKSARTKIGVGAICTGPCENSVTFIAPGPGQYFFRCDVHPVQMTGKLIVK